MTDHTILAGEPDVMECPQCHEMSAMVYSGGERGEISDLHCGKCGFDSGYRHSPSTALVPVDPPPPLVTPDGKPLHEGKNYDGLWQYTLVEAADPRTMVGRAQEMGAYRWELVHIEPSHGFLMGFFKRPQVDDEPFDLIRQHIGAGQLG